MIRLHGKTVVRVTTYGGGAMRKHGTWKQEGALPGMCALPKVPGARVSFIHKKNGVAVLLRTLS